MSPALEPSQAFAPSRPAQEVHLCNVAKRPAAFLHRSIALQAEVIADGMHGSVLIVPGCSRGLIPDFADAEAAGMEYERALFQGCPGTVGGKKIHARFLGTMQRKPNHFTSMPAGYVYVLRVASMKDLEVSFDPKGWCGVPRPMSPSGHINATPPNVFPAPVIPQ